MKKVINAIYKALRWLVINIIAALAVIFMLIALPFVFMGEICEWCYDALNKANNNQVNG